MTAAAWKTELRGPNGEWTAAGLAALRSLTPSHMNPVNVDVSPSAGVDPATAASAVRHAMDVQAEYVPALVSHQTVHVQKISQGNVEGQLAGDGPVISPEMLDPHYRQPKTWVPADPQYTALDTTLAHETGHEVADQMQPAAARYSPELWDPVAKAMGLPAPPQMEGTGQPFANLAAWWSDPKVQRKIARSVSSYAASNQDELGAELWAEYTTNSHPRPPARIYGDYVMAHLPPGGWRG